MRYDTPPNADSQCGRILSLLQSRAPDWVPLHEILNLKISQYGSRIKELRDRWGFVIENRRETVNGDLHTWFRLTPSTKPEPESISESDFMRRRREEEAQANPLFLRGAA